MKNIVIFDMDGTLIDSGHDITVSINHVRQMRYGLEPLSISDVVGAINAPSRNLAEVFYGLPIYEEGAKKLFEEHYHDQCIRNVFAYNGIVEVLNSLQRGGAVMGVATNAPGKFARRMLEHLGLSPYFEMIVGADDVDTPKPHPQMLHTHLEHHAYRKGTDNAWMIGDNIKDMEAAKSAGINSVFAAWGFASEGEGDHVATSPHQLLQLIRMEE